MAEFLTFEKIILKYKYDLNTKLLQIIIALLITNNVLQ